MNSRSGWLINQHTDIIEYWKFHNDSGTKFQAIEPIRQAKTMFNINIVHIKVSHFRIWFRYIIAHHSHQYKIYGVIFVISFTISFVFIGIIYFIKLFCKCKYFFQVYFLLQIQVQLKYFIQNVLVQKNNNKNIDNLPDRVVQWSNLITSSPNS